MIHTLDDMIHTSKSMNHTYILGYKLGFSNTLMPEYSTNTSNTYNKVGNGWLQIRSIG